MTLNISRFGRKELLLLAVLLLADQASKALIAAAKPAIDLKLFSLRFVSNTGAVWGFFQNTNMLFIWISIIAIGILIWAFDQIPEKAAPFYMMLYAGIIGNLLDRIFRGFVVDFIDFKFWPVFNFADAYISIGVVVLIILLWKEK